MAGLTTAILRAQRKAEELCGARLLWPDANDGAGFPCTTTELAMAERLSEGGMTRVDLAVATLRTEVFTANRPHEQDHCRLKVGPNEAWRPMRIESAEPQPGGDIIQFRLVARDQGA